MHNQSLKHIPGITDVSEEQAMAEFLFVNSLVCRGEFLPPREGMLSKFFVNMPPSYASRLLIGKDVNNNYFIALDEDMANYLMSLDFAVVVNNKYLAFSVNAINSNFIIRFPVLPEICNDMANTTLNGNVAPSDDSAPSRSPEPAKAAPLDDFFAELEAEASQAAQAENPQGVKEITGETTIKIETFFRPYGADYAFKRSPKSSRYVPISVADALLSIN